MEQKFKEVFKIKSRFWEIWKPKEKIIVINHCKHKWEEINKVDLIGWGGGSLGYLLLYKCIICGEMKKIIMDGNDH